MKKLVTGILALGLGFQLFAQLKAQYTADKVAGMEETIMQVLEAKHRLENKAYQKENEEVRKVQYLIAVRKIKAAPGYLSFIDKSITEREKELSGKWMDYKYVSPLSSIHHKSNMINRWQYLKIVRYSIFEVKADTLLSLDKIPFMREAYQKEVAREQKRSAETIEFLRKRSVLKL
ncbi:hypothetical protein U0035_02155 [Niabella yanshanensis]|uniref:Uncharacterized protein n=1 Tax=Niabella yanshanensis TaxID=577386 RepID=A0ABZ0W6R8_9BACT|nr:hypothetical protein [Niabella yanshanensis]WQD38947.1 hypothetical protein U0035_02155 [Niabella yanshanensis]